jgi:hypothetical protein
VLGFDSRRGLGIFLFTAASITALGPTQPPVQWVPGVLSSAVKQPGREADSSPPSSAESKNEWSYTSSPTIHLYGVVISYLKYTDFHPCKAFERVFSNLRKYVVDHGFTVLSKHLLEY